MPKASLGTIGSVPLPPGRWWVFAKLFSDDTSTSSASRVSCRLEVGGRFDAYAVDEGMDELAAGDSSVLALEQTRRLTGAGQARVRCQASTATTARFLKITAIRAGTLVSGTLGGCYTSSGNPGAAELTRRPGPTLNVPSVRLDRDQTRDPSQAGKCAVRFKVSDGIEPARTQACHR